jgi:hypothetical protein
VTAGGIPIGETLRAARKRAGLDIATMEERTHIRTRYLRALEDEAWHDLPSETYARAFLRTYAEELGLDAEALSDELRLRQGGKVSGAEQLITPPMGPERPPSRWVVAALAGGIIILLIVLASAGRDDGSNGSDRSSRAKKERGKRSNRREVSAEPAALTILPLTAARVCVVSGGRALVDRQILSAGNREQFPAARRFVIDLEFGEVRLKTRRERTRLRADSAGDPLTVVVRPGQIRQVPYSGNPCP